MIDAQEVKKQFPIFQHAHHSGFELAYLDNAATSQKPRLVLDAIERYYTTINANVGRGVYDLAHQSTFAFESTRKKVAGFLNCIPGEVIFTKGTTESINLVAASFLAPKLNRGMNVVVSQMEHHSNFVPWQMLCLAKDAEFRVVPLTDTGDIDLEVMEHLIDENTGIVACTHISNTLGTVNPISKIIDLAHASGVPVLIDGAQSIVTESVDLTELGADFYCFSGHKMFGPTGIGVLFTRQKCLSEMVPYESGGGMIQSVTNSQTTFANPPELFEAGTPHLAGVAGLDAAIDFLHTIRQDDIQRHIKEMNILTRDALDPFEGLEILPGGTNSSGILSFYMPSIHPHDIATFLDQRGIAVRAGHHCTEPLMRALNIPGTVRVSFSVFNHQGEIGRLVDALFGIKKIFG